MFCKLSPRRAAVLLGVAALSLSLLACSGSGAAPAPGDGKQAPQAAQPAEATGALSGQLDDLGQPEALDASVSLAWDPDKGSNDPLPAPPTPTPTPKPTWTIEVAFYELFTYDIDDGQFAIYSTDTQMEVYGYVSGLGSGGTSAMRNIAKWGNPTDCTANVWWETDSQLECPRQVMHAPLYAFDGRYDFAETAMCTSTSHLSCSGPYVKNNHKLTFKVAQGTSFQVSIHLRDYDWGTSDDDVCKASTWINPWANPIVKGAGWGELQQPDNGEAACKVSFYWKRVS